MPAKNSDSALQKYRPALTLEQIEHINSICLTELADGNCETETPKSITRILTPLIAKIRGGTIQPAYKIAQSTIDSAKITSDKNDAKSEQYRYENDLMSQYEQDAYEAKILGM